MHGLSPLSSVKGRHVAPSAIPWLIVGIALFAVSAEGRPAPFPTRSFRSIPLASSPFPLVVATWRPGRVASEPGGLGPR